jgi:hypothetical protein
MMLKRIAAAAVCALRLALPASAQVIGSGHALGNGTSSPAVPTDTPLISIMNQSGSGIGSGVSTILGVAAGTAGSVAKLGAAPVNGQCASFNSSGGIVPAGGACSVGGGGGTVNAGSLNQFGFYASTGNAISGMAITNPLLGPNVNNVVAAGADPTGVVDSTSVFQTIETAIGATGGSMYAPCGTYIVNSGTINIATKKSIVIQGGGSNCTIIDSPTGSTPLTISIADPTSTFHLRGFTVATGASNVGQGIDITTATTGEGQATNELTDINVRGDDSTGITNNYFTVGINIANGVSNINFTKVIMSGNNSFSGIGIALSGNVGAAAFGIVYNFVDCTLDFMGEGLLYGSFIQGVQITTSNFTGNNVGIFANTGEVGLDELAIGASQFNSTSSDITFDSPISAVNITGSNFGPFGTRNNFFSILGPFSNSSFTGNTFQQAGSGTGDDAIVTTNGSNGVVITGNAFIGGWNTANVFQATSSNINLQSNVYNGPTFKSSPASTTGSIVIGGGSP